MFWNSIYTRLLCCSVLQNTEKCIYGGYKRIKALSGTAFSLFTLELYNSS